MRRLRMLTRGPDRAAGMTLVEVLTAMVVLGIVLTLVTKALIGALDQQSNVVQQTQAQNTNNAGMELMTRLMRQAVPAGSSTSIISHADPSEIIFTSRLSSTGTATSACTGTVTNCSISTTPVNNYIFALPTGSTSLQWGQASCTGSTCATPTLSHTLVTGVRNAAGSSACSANTTGSGVFRYYWINQGVPTELTNVVNGQSQPLTSTQLAEIQYIEIDLYTATKTGPLAPACDPLQDYVELRN